MKRIIITRGIPASGKSNWAKQEVLKKQYKIEFKDFTNVPLNVCIERDSKRENPLGEKIIRDIFNKY